MGEIEIENFQFEWDDEKNIKNYKKHKIYFEDAAFVFLDDYRIEDYDELHSDEEDRIKVIGKVAKVLVVIYTERGEKFRLISARYANKDDEEEYYGQFNS
ncbi:MAG: BrnT family toxin [Selenomonadaceae bacterium]|nr:BrnT family toxin [Selenomonadaceae bacterium]